MLQNYDEEHGLGDAGGSLWLTLALFSCFIQLIGPSTARIGTDQYKLRVGR